MSESNAAATERLLGDRLRHDLVEALGETPCHLVGGAVRDAIVRRRVSRDWDLVLPGKGNRTAARLARTLGGRLVELGGDRFAAFRIVLANRIVDLWFRGDQALEEELARRDLTVNSLALDLAAGRIVDPMGGLDDVGRRLLRANAHERFDEDPVRCLRLLRFSQSLPGFGIEPATLRAAAAAVAGLGSVAVERVAGELRQVLASPLRESFSQRLVELDLYPRLWAPESGTPDSVEPPPELTVVDRRLRRLHASRASGPTPEDTEAVRHALLLRAALGSPAANASTERLVRRLDTMRAGRLVSRATARRVAPLLAATAPTSPAERRSFLYDHGRDWPSAAVVVTCSLRTQERSEILAALTDLATTEGDALFRSAALLDGEELQQQFGLRPGRRIGRLLAALRRAEVVGEVRTRTEAIRWVEEQLAARKGGGETSVPGPT